MGERANRRKAQCHPDPNRRRCGRLARKVTCLTPEDLSACLRANRVVRLGDGSAEVSRGHSSPLVADEGPNLFGDARLLFWPLFADASIEGLKRQVASGTREVPLGANRASGTVDPRVHRKTGTAGCVLRMSGGVGGWGRKAPAYPIPPACPAGCLHRRAESPVPGARPRRALRVTGSGFTIICVIEKTDTAPRPAHSWGDVDVFAGYVSGPAWRVGRLKDSHIHRWARSKDRWWRRAALVSTVALNRKSIGGTGDVPRTLDVCRMLVGDADDMVVKALFWALRELIRHDASAVRRFLVTHEGALARRVVREVNNKLCTGVKNPRRSAAGGTACHRSGIR